MQSFVTSNEADAVNIFNAIAFVKSENETTEKCYALSSNNDLTVRFALLNFFNESKRGESG